VDDFIVHVVADLADVEDQDGAGLTFAAAPAAPSLFATSTAIRFQIPERQDVELQVFDIGGRVVRTLLRGPLAAGAHVAEWNGRTDAGQEAPSGIYYYRINAGDNSATHKIVLTR
jgi:flagellar hook assembly protein FlgD